MPSKNGRYSTNGLIEDQYEPGSHGRVLKNKLKIKTIKDMNVIENFALRSVIEKCVNEYSEMHKFKCKDICRIHKWWLSDVYRWAGNYRNVNMAKDGFSFATARFIPQLMDAFEKETLRKYTPCKFENNAQIAEALAVVHIEFVLIHPFREGNGRVARLLANLMAIQNGLPLLDFSPMSKNKPRYHKAIHAGMDQHYDPMNKLFNKIIEESVKEFSS